MYFSGISSKVDVVPKTSSVTFGDTARLFCNVKHSNPKAKVGWRKQGSNVSITTGDRFTLIPNGALQINNLRFEEQGKYECFATNEIARKTRTSRTVGSVKVLPGMIQRTATK